VLSAPILSFKSPITSVRSFFPSQYMAICSCVCPQRAHLALGLLSRASSLDPSEFNLSPRELSGHGAPRGGTVRVLVRSTIKPSGRDLRTAFLFTPLLRRWCSSNGDLHHRGWLCRPTRVAVGCSRRQLAVGAVGTSHTLKILLICIFSYTLI
jgi:hypothetical protein